MSTSKMGSSTTTAAVITTRSKMRGIPREFGLIARFGYPHPSNCLSSIRLPAECVRQFAQPALFPVRRDVRKVLLIYPRRTLIGLAAAVGIFQHVLAI